MAALAALALLSSGLAHAADAVTLREAPTTAGPAITLGDLFENAGASAARAVAPAPPPGRTTSVPTRVVASAAAAAGLAWTPPEGLQAVQVSRGGQGGAAMGGGSLAIRRGEAVTLTFAAPGLAITMRTRALADAAAGAPVRLVNLDSQRQIDAIATGPGAARIDP